MSFRPKGFMWRALVASTAVSLLGVASALLDYGLSHGLLWRDAKGGLREELARLGPSLAPAARQASAAFAALAQETVFADMVGATHAAPAVAQGDTRPAASQDLDGGHLLTASMMPMPLGMREEPAEQDVNRQVKADRIATELRVPKLVLPEEEPASEGASAALFLLSPSIAAPALSAAAPPAPAPAPEQIAAAPVAAGPLAAATRAPFIHPPARNPFVSSATAASLPDAGKISWGDLVRMASMKGGDGEEPTRIFGALSEKEFRARELRCMATAVYFEARGEPVRGQIAVGQVIMNRVRSNFYPNTICGVVFQGQWNRNACQFSFACDGQTDAPKEPEQWKTALDVARQVISGKVYLSDIGEATHYHAVYVRPDWRRDVRRIKQLGVHIFYKAPFVQLLASDPDYSTL